MYAEAFLTYFSPRERRWKVELVALGRKQYVGRARKNPTVAAAFGKSNPSKGTQVVDAGCIVTVQEYSSVYKSPITSYRCPATLFGRVLPIDQKGGPMQNRQGYSGSQKSARLQQREYAMRYIELRRI